MSGEVGAGGALWGRKGWERGGGNTGIELGSLRPEV